MSFIELRSGNRRILGTAGCIAVAACFVAWFASGLWLDGKTGWPESYGFRCTGRCFLSDMWHSPALLHGDVYGWLKFAHMWLPFVAVALLAIWLNIRARNRATPFNTSVSE